LGEKSEEHFGAIKERLDIMNGRGQENRNRIIKLEVTLAILVPAILIALGLKFGGIY